MSLTEFPSTGGGIAKVEDDTTPKAGGNFDFNGFGRSKIAPTTTSQASTATLAINTDSYSMSLVTALAVNMTISAPTGAPSESQELVIRIKDNGTARTLTWNAIFRAIGVDLPLNTTASKTIYIGFLYNDTDTKWDCISVREEA